ACPKIKKIRVGLPPLSDITAEEKKFIPIPVSEIAGYELLACCSPISGFSTISQRIHL
ncbi:UNVERIFIED_CONTAM: hypothetical protein Sangu_3035000, partial [Sesamum angustifolium]